MPASKQWLIGALVLCITSSAWGSAWAREAKMGKQITLVREGQSDYRIVLPNRSSAAQRHAAEELASFLEQMSGARLPMVSEREWQGEPAVFVGLAGSARRAAPRASRGGLGSDGLVIMTAPPHLLLFGGEPRGTLYAVYTFLEEHLGCRWWTSTASTIPRRRTITLGAINDRQVPVLEYREPFFHDAFDGDWAVRNKSNGNRPDLDAARGGKITYTGFVHTFYPLVPPEQHFAQHPEWYSEIGGKRTADHAQLCLTNPELTAFVVGRVKEWLRANPRTGIISVSQNDWHGNCQCANCKALDDKEGSPAGSLLHFVNAVAREVGKEFPRVAIDTLAYQYTRKPPRYVRPEPNVIVRLCSIECNFARPLTDSSNRSFYQDLVGWSKVSQRLYVWDYVTNFAHYLRPHPNVPVLGPNVLTFVTNGVRGIFEQGSYTSPGGEMAALKAWVLAKLLWNPNRDANALIQEFLHGYFGPAGPSVGRYLDLVHEDAVSHHYYLGCFAPVEAPFPGYETMKRSELAYQQAFRAVAGEGELERRVRLARLPLLYTWLLRPDLVARAQGEGFRWSASCDFAITGRELVAICKENNISQHREGAPISELEQRLVAFDRHASAPPAGFEGVAGLVELPDYLIRADRAASYAGDAGASDGVCVVLPGDRGPECEAQGELWFGQDQPVAKYRCFATVKCELTGQQGNAFALGFYDHVSDEDLISKPVPISQVASGQWQSYEIGTVDLKQFARPPHLWVGMVGNGANVKSVAVDRFFLVPVP